MNGAQHVYGVTPDLSAFGKAFANGFGVSALVGRREFMHLGGMDHDRERVFLLSTTHGAATADLAAALATMACYEQEPVIETLYARGQRLREGVAASVRAQGLEGFFELSCRDCCLLFTTRDAQRLPSQEMRTLFMQELIRQRILAPSFVVSYSHSEADVDRTIEAVDAALRVYRRGLEDGPAAHLEGRSVKPVFRPFA